MTDTTQIKKNADGSINTAFYVARGRHMRSLAAHDMAASVKTGLFGRLRARMALAFAPRAMPMDAARRIR